MATINNGILNGYIKKPKNLTQYTGYRGITDFTDIGQFSQFETGYSFLSVIQMPTFIEKLAQQDATYVAPLKNIFAHILEYEFRGLDGLPDIGTENSTITDGNQEINMINNVTEDSAVTVSMNYFEKTGSPITKFAEYYLTGIKDKRSKAKTYHGLIKNGILDAGYENEVFTLLYYVTDNTYLELEKAVLLTNAQLTKCENIYNSTRGEIANKELSLAFQCFPITGREVDKAASKMLRSITGVNVSTSGIKSIAEDVSKPAVLDSSAFNYSALSGPTGEGLTSYKYK